MKKLHILLFVFIAHFSQAQHNWELLPPRNSENPQPVKIRSALKQGLIVEKDRNCDYLFDPVVNEWVDLKTDLGRLQAIGIFPSGKWIGEIEYKIHFSNDKGVTWELMSNYPPVNGSHKIMLSNDNKLFVGGDYKYYTSNDEGLNWVEHSAPGFHKLGFFFEQFQKVYLSGNNIIYNEIYTIHYYDTNSQILKRILQDVDIMNNHPGHSFMDTDGKLYFPLLIYNEAEDRYITEILEFEDINSEPKRTVIGPAIWQVDFSKNGNAVGYNASELFISKDFGLNWESILYDLPEQGPDADPKLHWIYDIAITDDNYLYVSLADGSIYVNKEILNSTSVNTTEINTANYISVYPNPATAYADFMITSTEELS